MPTAHHVLLKWLSAAVWYVGAVMLIWKGSEWLLRAAGSGGWGWPVVSGSVALGIGVVRGRTMFRRACLKNLRRIRSLESPRPWLFFRPVFYIALAAMFTAAFLLGYLARTGYTGMVVVGGLDLVIGTSLLMGSSPYWTWSPGAADQRSAS